MSFLTSLRELDNRSELVVDKDCTVAELKRKISDLFNTPYENVRVTKPRRYQMKDVSQLPLLPWESTADMALISASPHNIQDGDLILFKDSTEQEKVPLETLKEQGISTPAQHEKVKTYEPAVVIRTR
jgi:hypothetical protein